MKFIAKTYLHGGKSNNLEYFKELDKERNLNLSEEFLARMSYLNYEMVLEYEFDTEKYTAELLRINGQTVSNGRIEQL